MYVQMIRRYELRKIRDRRHRKKEELRKEVMKPGEWQQELC